MNAIAASRRVRVLFLGSAFAGHRTRFLNLQAHAQADERISATFHIQSGWRANGVFERLPFFSGELRGRIRTVAECAPFASLPRPDVIWTSAGLALTPFLWSQLGPLGRPLVRDLDWTLEQQEELAPWYYDRPARRGPAMALARLEDRLVSRSVTIFTPWSNWAAASLRRRGVTDARIRVLAPGVDLGQWRPRLDRASRRGGPLRLLFVGSDFWRKGGDLLLEVFRSRLVGRCELDIVTRQDVDTPPGARVLRAEPNSREIRAAYAAADLFVLPTRAECFGIAAIEAMASGLPVIMGNVGGASDIVVDGVTGWLIRPTAEALASALETAIGRRVDLPAMGRRARAVAERAFDGRRNDTAIIDLLVAIARRRSVRNEWRREPFRCTSRA